MASAEMRREVAKRLREADVSDRSAETFEEFNEQNSTFVMRVAECVCVADRVRLHYAPSEFYLRDLMDVLADLIDPPTCTMEHDEHNSGDELYPTDAWVCNSCGWIHYAGKPCHCENCGRMVVDAE